MSELPSRPIAFVLAAANHGLMITNRNDYHAMGQGTYGVGHQIMESGAHDQAEVNFALRCLDARRRYFGDGVVALDCGANIGCHAVEWGRFMHQWGRVLAFEAQERVFYALAGNLTINNCFNARAIWAALGAQAGQLAMPQPDYLKPASFGSLEIKQRQQGEFIGQHIDYATNTEMVQMISLDDCALPRVDFIKLDVEGMEIEVLHGASAMIDKHKPQMLIEQLKTEPNALIHFLQSRGYMIFDQGLNIYAIHCDDPFVKEIQGY